MQGIVRGGLNDGGGGESTLTGDAVVAEVISGKTFYSNDPNAKLTGVLPEVLIAGDQVVYNDDTESSQAKSSYWKMRDVDIIKAGTYRVVYSHKSNSGNGCYHRIYKNGSAFGTENYDTSTTYVEWPEDLVFAAGDNVQLYAYGISGAYNWVNMFDLRIDTLFTKVL